MQVNLLIEVLCDFHVFFIIVTYTFLSCCFISVLLGQDTFVVREMFPGSERVLFDSEEEEDYYFSDSDCT